MVKYEDMVEGREYFYDHWTYRKINGVLYYKPSLSGKWLVSDYSMREIAETLVFKEMPWVPRYGEHYYYPTFEQLVGQDLKIWGGTKTDNKIRKIVGVYKSPEEATQKATELGWLE